MNDATKIEAVRVDGGALSEKIKAVLRRYFECDDNGRENPAYDENFAAADAIDEIHALVGEI